MTARSPPRRGGEHPTYGVFIRGSELNNEYKLVGTRHYRYTSQCRSAKVINSIEQALLKAIDLKEISKFNGSLEMAPSTKDKELDKEGFVKQLKKKVHLHERAPGELQVIYDELVFTGVNHAPVEQALGSFDEREELTGLRAKEAALLRIR